MNQEPELKIGDVILNGKYRVEAFLGHGAIAQVYRVRHLGLKVDRAVKVVSREMSGVSSAMWEAFRARFQLEAQLGAQLDHPHVVRVYEFEEAEGRLYLVMEYMAEGSLADWLKQGPLPVAGAVRVTLDVAAGLQAVHYLRAVHRNVKPSNILLDAEGRAKVADLGLAQLPWAAGDGLPAESQALSQPGTPEYMSPEQAQNVAYLTPSSDVYSLGCVFFEMLTGRQRYASRPGAKGVREMPPEVPRELDDVLARMLREERGRKKSDAADSRKRYLTMTAVQEALRGAWKDIRRRERRKGRRQGPVILGVPALLALLMLIVVAVAGVVWWSSPKGPAEEVTPTALASLGGTQTAESVPVSPAGDTSTPAFTSTPTPAPQPTVAETMTPPVTPVPVTPTSTPVPSTPTLTPTDTPSNTPMPRPAQKATLTYTPVPAVLKPAPTPTPTSTPTPVPPTYTPTLLPTPTFTYTPVPPTPTSTDTPTSTPTVPPTGTPTFTPTATPTQTPTATPTASPAATPTFTATPTATATPVPTLTATVVPTATPTPTGTSTPTATPTSTATSTATATATPTATSTVTQTSTPTPCTNGLAFVADATVPDNSVIAPGVRLDKAWRVRNSGGCPWGVGYRLAFVSGDKMDAPDSQAVTHTLPGVTTEVTVTMRAPPDSGRYRATWRMADAQGKPFGNRLTVVIQVPTPGPPPIAVDNAAQVQLARMWQADRERVYSVAFAPDGATLASGGREGTVRLWQVADGSLWRVLTGHSSAVAQVAFSPDGTALASASADKTVRLWRVSDGTLLHTLSGHAYGARSVAFSPDGTLLASGSADGTVRLWRVNDGALVSILEDHAPNESVTDVAFSPDGQLLAAGSTYPKVRLWQVSNGTLSRILPSSSAPFSVAFSPNGAGLASGSVDSRVRLWQVSDGALLRTLKGHTREVLSVTFSPDGATLASASADHTVRLWDVVRGREMRVLQGHVGNVSSVAFNPDGRQLASGSEDGTVRLWSIK